MKKNKKSGIDQLIEELEKLEPEEFFKDSIFNDPEFIAETEESFKELDKQLQEMDIEEFFKD